MGKELGQLTPAAEQSNPLTTEIELIRSVENIKKTINILDLKDAKVCNDAICNIKEFWLITNTKFTSAAERYGECMGLKLLSWDYPKTNNLHDRIQRSGIYPVTVLTSITQAQAETLIARNVILCRDILEKPHILRHLHLTTKKLEAVMQEVSELTKS